LNVEILWQGAIRWKGMLVGKRTGMEEKKLTNRIAKKKTSEG
jgi:hypothetical protein